MKSHTHFRLAAGVLITGTLMAVAPATQAASETDMSGGSNQMMSGSMMAEGLMLPEMDSEQGRKLFASKGCVVCHSINGVGGEDAPPLDASTMSLPMNPFDFAAKMWRGAEAMVILQREELGEPIELTGDELANIIAFVHDADEQAKFSDDDLPEAIAKLIGHMDKDDDHGD